VWTASPPPVVTTYLTATLLDCMHAEGNAACC